MKINRLGTALCCISIAFAIILGALGAHKLEAVLSEELLESFKTGVDYHLFHSMALLVLFQFPNLQSMPGIRITRTLLLLGILFFSGSIYLLSTSGITGLREYNSIFGPLTPLGGMFFIVGWLHLAIRILFSISPNRTGS